MDEITRLRAIQFLKKMPPGDQAALRAVFEENTRAKLFTPYYSTVRVRTTRTGAGPFTYTALTAEATAFGYKVGDDMSVAGFAAGSIATFAETNLRSGGTQTNNNSNVKIWGIAAELCPGSEPKLARKLWRNSVVKMALNANYQEILGPLTFFPSGGGLYGQERSLLEAGQLIETAGPLVGQLANGNPMASNFFKFPKPILWNAQGSGKRDASFSLIVQPTQAFTETATDRAANAGAAPGLSGRVEAFTSPADGALGTFVEIRFRLLCEADGERSDNV